ncbi:MAG: chloride channel protein [Acidimicrobiales bacterium]|jgi:H+/Cl- antiporter ClcA
MSEKAENERKRVPPPLVRKRIASARGATEQPNVTGDGETALTPVFWAMVALTGVAAGLFGDGLMDVLFGVQHLAFGYHSGSFQSAVEHASVLRRVAPLLAAGAFGGVAWYLLRRYTEGESSQIDEEVWSGDGRLSLRRSLGTSLISEVVIGMGASIGREAAPKLMGGVSGSVLATWARLSPPQRRLLVACGGGAGLAAVYNVPLGGALFTAEILCGAVNLPVVLPALACSFTATAVAWVYLPDHATYIDIPAYRFTTTLLVCAVLMGPVVGVVSSAYVRLVGWASHHRPSGLASIGAPLVAFGALGLVGIAYPQLFGNGQDMAHSVFLGQGGFALLCALLILKPLVTVLCLAGARTDPQRLFAHGPDDGGDHRRHGRHPAY